MKEKWLVQWFAPDGTSGAAVFYSCEAAEEYAKNKRLSAHVVVVNRGKLAALRIEDL